MLHNLNFDINPGEKVLILNLESRCRWHFNLRSAFLVELVQERAPLRCPFSALSRPQKVVFLLTDGISPRWVLQIFARSWQSSLASIHSSVRNPILCLSYLSEDPTILSGTLRSTLDVFDEYEDAEIVSVHPLNLGDSWLTSQVWGSSSCPFDSIWGHPRRGYRYSQCKCFP